MFQVTACWAVSPAIVCCFSAIVFEIIKSSVLERQDSLKRALQLILLYLAFTAAILTRSIVVEVPYAPDLEDVAGTVAGSIIAVFFGVLIIDNVFFVPYFNRKLVK